MYNYLMSGSGWNPNRDTLPIGRFYPGREEKYKLVGDMVSPALLQLPALLMPEVDYDSHQTAHVATIHAAKLSGHKLTIDYTIDPDIPPLNVPHLISHASELGISTSGVSLQHTHWAVNDADLFRTLLKIGLPKLPEATVFKVDQTLREKKALSVMMPFDPGFTPVYSAIKLAADATGYDCNRADDIWLHHYVIQTIVSLICRSGLVIVDCSKKNPNVFYEVGIAHTLGRDVILIAQNIDDVPFDLRHISIITYLSNTQGLTELTAKLIDRIKAVEAAQDWD